MNFTTPKKVNTARGEVLANLPGVLSKAMNAEAVAANIVTSPTAAQTLDFSRRYSLGVGRGKSLLSESIGSQSVSFTVTNTYSTAKVVALGALVNSMFADAAALKTVLSADAIITDGVIAGSGDDTITVVSNDPGRLVGNFLRYAATSPTRITGAYFTSLNVSDNSPNSANFDGTITTAFVSPFADPIKKYMNMRALRSSGDFAKEYAEIDFRKSGMQVLIGPENFTTFVIQPNSSFTMVLYVGAQASTSQRMYRDLNQADTELSNAGLFI